MARLPLVRRRLRRNKKIVAVLVAWMNILHLICWFFQQLCILIVSKRRFFSFEKKYMHDFFSRRELMFQLAYKSDTTCIEQLRMDRKTFKTLCTMLENIGGLKETRFMMIDEQVALSLHILAHHVKNRVIKFRFKRSGETISRHFKNVLTSMLSLHRVLLKKPELNLEDSNNTKWKWFKHCLGAIDGTYIKVRVPLEDKPRYRNRKGEIATNVLAVCSPDEQFIYVLPGWEGSAADGRVLRDAISRRNGLKVPLGQYYLVDAGYTNFEGFLTPYRGQRYHLNDWSDNHRPTTPEEFFNMKHSSARNTIERCFGLLKMRWAILRSPSFYPIKIQNRIILSCCLLENLIKREMTEDPLGREWESQENIVEEPDEIVATIDTSQEWTSFRDNLARSMFDEWRARR